MELESFNFNRIKGLCSLKILDLGQRNEADLRKLGLTITLVTILKPYLGNGVDYEFTKLSN